MSPSVVVSGRASTTKSYRGSSRSSGGEPSLGAKVRLVSEGDHRLLIAVVAFALMMTCIPITVIASYQTSQLQLVIVVMESFVADFVMIVLFISILLLPLLLLLLLLLLPLWLVG